MANGLGFAGRLLAAGCLPFLVVCRTGVAAEPPVSFSTQVVPLLVNACGACHVAGRKGGFSMASHAALIRSGMVSRGSGRTSRLVEVILTGEMPRGGGTVTAEQVAMLVAWIDAGAPCDAPDPTAGLESVAMAAAAPRIEPRQTVRIAPGEASFAVDVAPLLVDHCLDCHGGDAVEAGLDVRSLDRLLRGGRSGKAVNPADAADSLLVRKLRGSGIEGQRMPLGRPPLSDGEISGIERWIREGARLDVLSPRDPLETIAAVGRSRSLDDERLADLRAAAAVKLWRRSLPDVEPTVRPAGRTLVVGNLPEGRLADVAALVGDVGEAVRRELVAGTAPLLKGGVVVYVFAKSVDYSGFWQLAMGCDRPREVTGHGGVAGEVVYAALVPPPGEDTADLRLAVAEQIAAAALVGRAAPAWYGSGAGRVVAAKVAPKAQHVRQWRTEVRQAAAHVGSVQDFLSGAVAADVGSAAAGGLLASLGGASRVGQVVRRLDRGERFDEAFERVYRTTAADAVARWLAGQGR